MERENLSINKKRLKVNTIIGRTLLFTCLIFSFTLYGKDVNKKEILSNSKNKKLNKSDSVLVDKKNYPITKEEKKAEKFIEQEKEKTKSPDKRKRTPPRDLLFFLGSIIVASFYLIISNWTRIKNYFREKYLLPKTKSKLLGLSAFYLNKLKKNRKYIPEVFVELDNLKEKVRYFSDPILFWKKCIEDIERIDLKVFNRQISNFNIPDLQPFSIKLPKQFKRSINLRNLGNNSTALIEFLNKKVEELKQCNCDKIINKIPDDRVYPYQDYYVSNNMADPYIRKIKDVIESLKFLKKRVLFVTSKAGQGKTNFVCDFTEKVLLKKKQMCLFIPVKEFNNTQMDIKNYILTKLFKDENIINFEVFMKKADDMCKKENSFFIFILDGLNESVNYDCFSKKLEMLIEELLPYYYVKFIITCRTEYLKRRFSNFEEASFKEDIINRENHYPFKHEFEERLLSAYFKFFKINSSSIGSHVSKQLSSDFLLLRFFCETYGNTDSTNLIPLPSFYDIYKEDLFTKYFNKKVETIGERINLKFHEVKINKLIREIIEYMIENEKFDSVPISKITDTDFLAEILSEDIILQEDLLGEEEQSLAGSDQVISFTFDEFRDFCLANYLIKDKFENDPDDFEEIIDKFISPDFAVAEGLRKYLFYISKRITYDNSTRAGEEDCAIMKIIKNKEWYNEIFLECIFSINEKYITDEDIEKVVEKFKEGLENSKIIILNLLRRYDDNYFKKINILNLFDIINKLSKDEYQNLVVPFIFENIFDFGESYPYRIEFLLDELSEMIEKKRIEKEPKLHNIFPFLIFLFGDITESESRKGQLIELYKKYVSTYPEIAEDNLIKYVKLENPLISEKILRILTDFIDAEIFFPRNFALSAIKEIIKHDDSEKYKNTINCILEFLSKALNKEPDIFSNKQRKYIAANAQDIN